MKLLVISPGQIAGDFVLLAPDQEHYLTRVRRAADGTELTLLVEPGAVELEGVLRLGTRRGACVQITVRRPVPPRTGPQVTLAVALMKADVLEDILRTVTELGVDRLVLLAARRSIADWKGSDPRRHERIVSILRSAAGQSGNRHPPTLEGPVDVATFLASVDPRSTWMAMASGGIELNSSAVPPNSGPLTMLVGPEGDFDPVEVEVAGRLGIPRITLGTPVLRTPTAVIVLATLALRMTGRL